MTKNQSSKTNYRTMNCYWNSTQNSNCCCQNSNWTNLTNWTKRTIESWKTSFQNSNLKTGRSWTKKIPNCCSPNLTKRNQTSYLMMSSTLSLRMMKIHCLNLKNRNWKTSFRKMNCCWSLNQMKNCCWNLTQMKSLTSLTNWMKMTIQSSNLTIVKNWTKKTQNYCLKMKNQTNCLTKNST